MDHFKPTIIRNTSIAQNYFELEFTWPSHSVPLPGQFLTLRIADQISPLLRRPFAFSGFNKEDRTASIIYEKRGPATSILSAQLPGEALDVIGPLGNSFPAPINDNRPVLVAGGVGMGPMFFLAEDFLKHNIHPLLFLGARTKAFIPNLDLFQKVQTLISTDDGTAGFSGTSVSCFQHYLETHENHQKVSGYEVYACGPNPMMQALDRFSRNQSWPTWLSMEQTMGCAVGACMGCVVKVITNTPPPQGFAYARVCTEGPIFPGHTLIWEENHGQQ